ncbi:hypothetical protein GE061_009946 [Apolygus lucorum]|uniref:Neurite outgrowth-associated protein n=1 Tax=Apolygus lucorum TaxID=248454 RepID=A0A8S9Y2Z6_APOLU|nr:hypothetical protein GE061_009946 [Apolygus lucorum]
MSRGANPGVGRRLKILKQETPDLSKMRITKSDVDDLEVDIMNAGALSKEYEREHDKVSKRIEFQRVERKYFDKIKSPNFLLWSEKEQIRQMYESQPDKWTFDQLSQSFPATPEVIKKIVKSQWKLKDSISIEKHDKRVLANWKMFQEKKLELPNHISSHLSKFTGRDRSLPTKVSTEVMLEESEPKVKMISSTKKSEFADIIRNYGRKDGHSTSETQEKSGSNWAPTRPGETYVLNIQDKKVKKSSPHLTLSQMKMSGKISPSESTLQHQPPTEGVTSGQETKKATSGVINPSDFSSVHRWSSTDSSSVKQTDEPPDEIPMKIVIPKNKWKKGTVYRVNNCFYADDGEFLYKI